MAAAKTGMCFNCGSFGHLARDCTREDKVCYNCHGSGHVSKDCPNPRADKTCYKCGAGGHLARDCPVPPGGGHRLDSLPHGYSDPPPLDRGYEQPGYSSWSDRGRGGFGRHDDGQGTALECYKCGRFGHISRNCPQNGSGYGDVPPPRGFSNQKCYTCGGYGHLSKDCQQQAKCYNCGGFGHISRECPSPRRGQICYKCNSEGHISRDCPNEPQHAPAPF